MKSKYKKYILIIVVLSGFFCSAVNMYAQYYGGGTLNPTSTAPTVANGQLAPQASTTPPTSNTPPSNTPSSTSNTNYQLLTPLPDPNTPGTPMEKINTDSGIGIYLNLMIKIFIGICAVLSVIMIIMGGLQIMTSEIGHTKEAGREQIQHAVLGLIIALGAWALLYTINPALLKSDIKVDNVAPPATTATPPATFVGDNGQTQILNGAQQGSGNYCAVVLIHLPTRRGQAPQTSTSELCKPTLAECQQEVSYYGGAGSPGVLQSCHQKNN